MDSVKERNYKETHRHDNYNERKRKRSRSRSPKERRGREYTRRRRRSRSYSPDGKKVIKEERKPKAADDMINTRTGGAYIPPARLRMMQAQMTDKSSLAYQRLAWEALKKSIHGHINKINVGNIGIIIKELMKENIVRGRGLLCRSLIQAQAASPTFTNVYAALVAAVNSRFPNIGELLLKRLVIQFKRGFKRNDKSICISSASFIAHVVNQRVAHEILALELLTILVESPTDDSVEVAIAFLKECGQKLLEVSTKGVNAIFEMLRNILHEGQLDKRVQYMIEVMFQVWKDGFKDHPAVIEELELVSEEDQFTHLLTLDDATDGQDILNVFKLDDKYEENEQKYKTISKEILGSDVESGGEEGASGSGSGSEESDDEEETEENKITIIDKTETNLIALRRTIYLTINSSLDFEECAHKLLKMQLKPGQEIELCHMFLDCCAEQRTYEKFYGLLAQRFCNINRLYIGPFEEIFKDSYGTAHRLDTNRLRNVSKFFAHLLFTDSISWEVLECVKLNEEDTTSSSRIYIKILFQELAEYMGLKKLNDRLKDPTLQEAFNGIFPRDNPKNTRFSINFFTSIGLGGLTDELREHLKQMPKNVPPPITSINVESDSDSSSSSDSSSDSSSSDDSSSSNSSDSETEKKSKKRKKNTEESKKESKSVNKNNKEASKENDRWGHDGFYDTYGKDARRHEADIDRNNYRNSNKYNKVDDRSKINDGREKRGYSKIHNNDETTQHNRSKRNVEDKQRDIKDKENEEDRYSNKRNKQTDEETQKDKRNKRNDEDTQSDKRKKQNEEDKQSVRRSKYDNEDRQSDKRNKQNEDRQSDRRYKQNDDDRESDRRNKQNDDDRESDRRNKQNYDDRESDRRNKQIDEDRRTDRRNKLNDDDRESERRNKQIDEDRRSDRRNKQNDDDRESDRRNKQIDEDRRSDRRNKQNDDDKESNRRNKQIDEDRRSHKKNKQNDEDRQSDRKNNQKDEDKQSVRMDNQKDEDRQILKKKKQYDEDRQRDGKSSKYDDDGDDRHKIRRNKQNNDDRQSDRRKKSDKERDNSSSSNSSDSSDSDESDDHNKDDKRKRQVDDNEEGNRSDYKEDKQGKRHYSDRKAKDRKEYRERKVVGRYWDNFDL